MTSNKTLKHYPLSSPQLDFWFDQILHPDVPLYNIGGYVRIEGPIDPAIFEKALNQVIQENDALRIILHEGESLPTQTFAENVHLKLDFHDFSEQENAHESALKWMKQEFVKPFQLYDGFLFQFALCKISANCYYGFNKYHHIIVDGWAISLIVQRVATAYNSLTSGQTSEQTNYAYPDFIQNDQAYLESEKFVKAKRYWQEKYREVLEPLLVRRYASQFKGQTIPSQRATLRLQRSFYNQLIDFAKENKVSTFHVILGALYCYFVRTCHREDLIIGLPTLNRNNATFKKTAGLFINVSPAWFRFGTDLSFIELMEKIRKELQKDYRHQRFPLGEINRQAGQHNHQQLFDLTLSYAKHNYDTHFNGNPGTAVYFTNGFTQNALAVFIEEFHQQDDVNIYFDYNLGFFYADEIERLKARFEFLLGEIIRHPSVPVRKLQIMPDVELKKILVDWNDTETDYPRDKTVVDLFEEQVDKTPNAIAVVFEGKQLTYRGLNSKANQLAQHLQILGVKPEVLVALCVERSLDIIIGLLGIMKAGGAYLPLDPTYPTERLAFMLEDAQVPVLLTQSSLKEKLPETQAQIVCLDVEAEKLPRLSSENIVSGVGSENLAYVIYTSGSTGNPKGVQIGHLSLLNFLTSMQKQPCLTSADVFLAITTISFDIAALELYLPLIVGAKIVLASRVEVTDGLRLLEKLNHDGITVMQATPATWYLLLTSGWKSTPQLKILCGGEALPPQLATQLLEKCQSLWNLYGPTETTIWSLMAQITVTTAPISIGHPIANTQIHILDQYLQPVPIGVPGELHIGGAGVARGYLNRPDLTAEKFIKNPFSKEPNWLRRSKDSRLYKTGDLVRYLPDGNLEYLGRIDNQVKIRGFRIELGEIEAALAQHPFVKENAVIVHEVSQTDKRLVAYIVLHKGQVIENTTLRSFLTERLPDYMVPSAFVTLENLPLTPNGKIDRRALSQLSVISYQLSEETFVTPRTPDEKLLAGIWASVLGIERVGIHDNFFELGGHSLSGTQLMSRICDTLSVAIPLRQLFESPTIAGMAKIIDKTRQVGIVATKTVIDLNAEAVLDSTIQPPTVSVKALPKSIFLSGATGFLGAYLLYELLVQTTANIYCLVRAENADEGQKRLQSKLESYFIWNETFRSRIIPIIGELSQPLLALSEQQFQDLANQIDVIYHNGALVNFVYPYHTLKATNVLGTQEILRLASHTKIKPVHYVSTLSVFDSSGYFDGRIIRETDALNDSEGLFFGYAQSKWVAEKLVMAARERGLPVCIYRPGTIVGHSQTNIWNPDDFIFRMIKGCIQLGKWPDLNITLHLTPVDYVSQAIVHLSQQPESLGKAFHLLNSHHLQASQLFDWINSFGYPIQQTPYHKWQTELVNIVKFSQKNTLSSLTSLFIEKVPCEE